MIECPKCHAKGEEEDFEVAIRQGGGVADVGFRCSLCNAEFGFEIFEEET